MIKNILRVVMWIPFFIIKVPYNLIRIIGGICISVIMLYSWLYGDDWDLEYDKIALYDLWNGNTPLITLWSGEYITNTDRRIIKGE